MKPSNKGKPRPKPDHHSKNTGPGKSSGIKSTAEEVKHRVQQCVELFALRRTKHEIIAAITKQYGVHWRTADEYTVRARNLMMERAQRPKSEFVADAIGLYENVIKSADATKKDRLSAQMGLNNLLGLDAPKQVHTQLSGPDGGKIEVETKVAQPIDHEGLAKVARRLFGISAPDGNGESIHSPTTGVEAGVFPGHNGH